MGGPSCREGQRVGPRPIDIRRRNPDPLEFIHFDRLGSERCRFGLGEKWNRWIDRGRFRKRRLWRWNRERGIYRRNLIRNLLCKRTVKHHPVPYPQVPGNISYRSRILRIDFIAQVSMTLLHFENELLRRLFEHDQRFLGTWRCLQ
jgi:hypothetical protein